jgi:predicted molibdopterin-dependent oxidoreductase YjgC
VILAGYADLDWNYQHPSEIMAEIASLTPLFAGVTYEIAGGSGYSATAVRRTLQKSEDEDEL